MRKCEVYIHLIKVGELVEVDSHHYTFTYSSHYLQDKNHPPVCLNMPLREDSYESDHLFPFFFNMLSEGENRMMQSQYLHIPPEDDFGILLPTPSIDNSEGVEG